MSERTVIITARVAPTTRDALRRAAAERGLDLSTIVRDAVRDHLRRNPPAPAPSPGQTTLEDHLTP